MHYYFLTSHRYTSQSFVCAILPGKMADCQCGTKLVIFLLIFPRIRCHYLAENGRIITGVWSNGKHPLKRRSIDNSLKIMVYSDSSMLKVSSHLRNLIADRLLPDAVAYFRKTLSVRQPVSPLRLQRDCSEETRKRVGGNFFRYCIGECKNITYCGLVGTIRVPEAHLDVCRTCDSSKKYCTKETSQNFGLANTDFVLYVSAFATSDCNKEGDIIAYASTCQQEGVLDRPIAGFVNFCVGKMARNLHYNHLLAIVKHEIFHAIGFSTRLYGYYRAEDGTPLTGRIADGRPAFKWSNKVITNCLVHMSNFQEELKLF